MNHDLITNVRNPQFSNAYRRHDLTSMSKSPTFTILINSTSKHLLAKFPEFLKYMLAIWFLDSCSFKKTIATLLFQMIYSLPTHGLIHQLSGLLKCIKINGLNYKVMDSKRESWQRCGWKTLVYKKFSSLQWQSMYVEIIFTKWFWNVVS